MIPVGRQEKRLASVRRLAGPISGRQALRSSADPFPTAVPHCRLEQPRSQQKNDSRMKSKMTTGADPRSVPRKLCLDQFLKLSWIAETGGHAKFLIQNGEVSVNGEIETRRRRQLVAGDVVVIGGKQFPVNDSLFAE